MTDHLLFAAESPPDVSVTDAGTQYTLGTEWGVTAPGWYLKGYRFYRPADLLVTGPIVARSYDAVTQAALPDTDATFVLAGSGWQTTFLPEPVAIAAGVPIRMGVHFPGGWFAATSDYWSTGPGAAGVTDGPLIGYGQSAATENEQGSFTAGAALSFPAAGSPVGSNYWITPIITDVVEDFREGSVTAAVGVGAASGGVKQGAGAVTTVQVLTGQTAGGKGGSGVVGAGVAVTAVAVGGLLSVAPAPVSPVLCAPWATPADVPAAVKTALGITDAQLAVQLMRASEILWALSGRRWYGGGCTETAVLHSNPAGGYASYHGTWGRCSCWLEPDGAGLLHIVQPVRIRLPRGPVQAVTSVTVAGVLLSPMAYEMNRSGWLERIDGGSWPVCSGDTVVEYTFGEPPPAGGRDAAVALGIELARDAHNLGECRLPRRVTSITRQNLTMTTFDPQEFLDKGRVGLTVVDMWLAAVNPRGVSQGGSVWSLDLNTTRRRL